MRTFSKNAFVIGSTLLATCMLTACSPKTGGTTPGGGTTPTGGSTYELQTPTLTSVSPSTVSLGQTVQVFGQNFIDPSHGTLMLYLVGSFTDTQGNSSRLPSPVQIPLTYVGAGEATFTFGPNVNPVSPTGLEIGSFSGNFQVVNTLTADAANAQPNDMLVSAQQQLSLTLGPSIFIDQMRSVDDPHCDPYTQGTIGGQNIALGFHYVGMDDASSDDPVTYTVQYDPTQLTVAYLNNQPWTNWPNWGATMPNAQAVEQSGQGSFSMQITQGNQIVFNPQTTQQVVTVSPAVTFNQQNATTAVLAGLATPSVDVGQTDTVLLTVTATHQASGTSISRAVNWSAGSGISFSQPTQPQLIAWEAAMLDDHIGIVKGSLPNGTNMSYNESASDSKAKTISMSWNDNYTVSGTVGAALNIGNNKFINFGINASVSKNWSQTFGTDVSSSDTVTTMQGSNTSVQVNPGMFGAFYIQWGDVTSSVTVNVADACGVATAVGTATLTAHTGYLVPETSTENPPPCPIDEQDCHPAGPVAN